MMRLRRAEWRTLGAGIQREIAGEAAEALARMEREGPTALFSMLGHKGDLMLIHFRPDFAALNDAELAIGSLRISEYLEPSTSYLSVVELGLYESTVKLYSSLAERGVQPGSAEWEEAVEETTAMQKKAMAPRLKPEIPEGRFVSFYPMSRKRGETRNWYAAPLAERQRMMHQHGVSGRKYAGEVKQIISGSIGFDDWEWGVDLFADNPLVFKRLVYEMRFDEGSAVYADFGPFYIGRRFRAAMLPDFLSGRLPE
jgi:hydrogen peroxide-dependent heme synthase